MARYMLVDYKIMEKFVYIKKSQSGKFLEFPERFNEELFDNIGNSWEDYEDNCWVLLSSEQVQFHEEHPDATVKEVWDMEILPKPEPPVIPDEPEEVIPEEPEEVIPQESALERKLREIDEYSDVYSFVLNNKTMWLSKQECREILDDVSAYRALKEKTMTRWIDDIEYTFTLVQWTKIAQRVNVYTSKVENVKNTHKKNVSELQNDTEIEEYDYTTGYPEKPNFEDL